MSVPTLVPLTDREEEIGKMIAAGLEIKDIAQVTGLAVSTVATYIRILAMKLPGTLPPMKKIMRWWLTHRAVGRETPL